MKITEKTAEKKGGKGAFIEILPEWQKSRKALNEKTIEKQ